MFLTNAQEENIKMNKVRLFANNVLSAIIQINTVQRIVSLVQKVIKLILLKYLSKFALEDFIKIRQHKQYVSSAKMVIIQTAKAHKIVINANKEKAPLP
jgi:hypothetical protein